MTELFDISESRMLEFDEAKHQYSIDGVGYDSVTTILGRLGVSENFDGVNAGLLAARAARGKRIHLALQYYRQGVLDMESVNVEDRPYVEAGIKFCDDYPGWRSLAQERRFWVNWKQEEDGKILGYCGGMDEVMHMTPGTYKIGGREYVIEPGTIGIFDDKTSAAIVPSYRYQIGGGYLMGVAQGFDGDDLDTPLREVFEKMIGGEITKVYCFIRHLRHGHYNLIPIPERETYAAWDKMLQKYFYPDTRIDIEKMVKNQIDLPTDIARRMARTHLLKKRVEERYAEVGKNAEEALIRDGVAYNGVAEIGGYRVTYSKGLSGWKPGEVDEAAFVKKVLAITTETITKKELTDMYASCKMPDRETEGTWTRRVTKIKSAETKSETKSPQKSKSVEETKPSSEMNPAISGNATTTPATEKTQEKPAPATEPEKSGKPEADPLAPHDLSQATVFDVTGEPVPPSVTLPSPDKPVKEKKTRKKKGEAATTPPAESAPIGPHAEILAAKATPATTEPAKEEPVDNLPINDFDPAVPAALVADIVELANKAFIDGMTRNVRDGVFRGWLLSAAFRDLFAEVCGITPLRDLTEGQCVDLRTALNVKLIKKQESLGATKTHLLGTQLLVEVMNAYRLSELDAKNKIMDFCRLTFGRNDWLSFDETRMRELINKMGAAMATELLSIKTTKPAPASPSPTEPKEEPELVIPTTPAAAPAAPVAPKAPAPKPVNNRNDPDF